MQMCHCLGKKLLKVVVYLYQAGLLFGIPLNTTVCVYTPDVSNNLHVLDIITKCFHHGIVMLRCLKEDNDVQTGMLSDDIIAIL